MKQLLFFTLTVVLIGCGEPQPRRPIEVKTGSVLKKSVERNKELLAQEEQLMLDIIKKDSLNEYFHSGVGSWYHYIIRNKEADYHPQTDDLVTLQYNIMTFNNDTIYSKEDIGIITYKVDKQNLFPGLRNSVKLLKENETATFLYPSSLAFGYHGDDDRIGINVPIKSTITLLKIDKQQENNQN